LKIKSKSILLTFTSIVLACLVAIAFAFPQDEIRDYLVFYYDLIFGLGTVSILAWYCFLNWDFAIRKTILPFLLISFVCLAIGDFGYNRINILREGTISTDYLLFYKTFYTLGLGLIVLALVTYFKIYKENLFIIFCILSVSFGFFLLQYNYLLINECPNGPYYYLCNIIDLIYSSFSAIIFGVSTFYCLRTLHIGEFVFLHLLIRYTNLDFTSKYQITQLIKNESSSGVTGFFWTVNLGLIFLVFFLSYIQGQIVFSKKDLLANWISIRTVFGLSMLILLLIIILFITRIFAVGNPIGITFILNSILFCCFLSNIIAFSISSKFKKIGLLMGSNKVNEIGIDGSPGIQVDKIKEKTYFSSEMNFIIDQYNQMADKFNLRGQRLVEFMSKKIQSEKDVLRGQIANQLAHDIESPLGAIQTIITCNRLDTDETREVLWTALTSIRDIVSRLYFRSNELKPHREPTIYSASASLEKIFKMKHAEFSEFKINLYLKIAHHAQNSFFSIDLDSFRSIMSNLMNNSKDEILKKGKPGTISVHLDEINDFVLISILDDGEVVSEAKLQDMNHGTCLSTKHSEKPCGISHAKEKLRMFGGSLYYSKIDPIGLNATITLPSHKAPAWIATEIHLLSAKNLVVFDDDESIHQLVRIRLHSDPQLASTQLISCKTVEQLSEFVKTKDSQESLFLVDYEFRGSHYTGLDYIKQFNLSKNSILMTSHWDEEKVIQECKLAKIKLLPKHFSHSVPMINGAKKELDFILVEDSSIVELSWRILAQSYQLSYRFFSDPAYFQMHSRELPTDALLFVDYHLPGQTGFELLQSLNGEFENYYILTHESKDQLPTINSIDENRILFGKEFPLNILKRKNTPSNISSNC